MNLLKKLDTEKSIVFVAKYLIFDGNAMKSLEKKKKKLSGKLQQGSIYIETNSTNCPLIQVNYSFMPDLEKIEKIISGNVQPFPRQMNEFNFDVKIKYSSPYGLEKMSNLSNGENITIFNDN